MEEQVCRGMAWSSGLSCCSSVTCPPEVCPRPPKSSISDPTNILISPAQILAWRRVFSSLSSPSGLHTSHLNLPPAPHSSFFYFIVWGAIPIIVPGATLINHLGSHMRCWGSNQARALPTLLSFQFLPRCPWPGCPFIPISTPKSPAAPSESCSESCSPYLPSVLFYEFLVSWDFFTPVRHLASDQTPLD